MSESLQNNVWLIIGLSCCEKKEIIFFTNKRYAEQIIVDFEQSKNDFLKIKTPKKQFLCLKKNVTYLVINDVLDRNFVKKNDELNINNNDDYSWAVDD